MPEAKKMPNKRRCKVQRITFVAEMVDGERCVMVLEGKECDETVGIAWAPLFTGEHPWAELYEGLAARERNAKLKADYKVRAQLIRDLPPYPGPKPYLCWPDPGPLSPQVPGQVSPLKPGLVSPLKLIPR